MAAATVATVTAALCNSHSVNAFHSHSFKSIGRIPLHLDSLDTTRIENDSRLTSTSLIMAVTDPETLLVHRVQANQKKTTRKNSLQSTGGTRNGNEDTAISRQDLFMLESSFGLDSSTIERQIPKEDKLKVQKKKRAGRKVARNTTRIKVTKEISARKKSSVKKSLVKKNPTISASNRKAVKVTPKLKKAGRKIVKNTTRIRVEKDLSPKRQLSAKKRVTKEKPAISATDSKTMKAITNPSRKSVVSKPANKSKVNGIEKKAVPRMKTTVKAVNTSSKNIRKKSTSMTTRLLRDKTKSQTRNKSSTMPGFMDRKNSKRHKSFRDGLKIAQNSNLRRNRANAAAEIGRHLNSAEETKKRTKANSEAMYYSSATVPDSLIAFANEFHQVRYRDCMALFVFTNIHTVPMFNIYSATIGITHHAKRRIRAWHENTGSNESTKNP